MVWLSLLKVVLGLASSLSSYLRDKGLLEAGETKELSKMLDNSIDILDRSNTSRNDAIKRFDDTDGVPDDNDPNLRD